MMIKRELCKKAGLGTPQGKEGEEWRETSGGSISFP